MTFSAGRRVRSCQRCCGCFDRITAISIDAEPRHRGDEADRAPEADARIALWLVAQVGQGDGFTRAAAASGVGQRRDAEAGKRSTGEKRQKGEPLTRALAGKKAWITGLRQEQSAARAEVPLQDDSEVATKNLSKFNPLAQWTWGDVWHYIATHNVDYNPLHDQFFPSIGCAPCTRAISLGEEFRAGRWWWEDEAAKECGLHVKK
mgnify:CR=1 FL=1